jgi:hypothetical protein
VIIQRLEEAMDFRALSDDKNQFRAFLRLDEAAAIHWWKTTLVASMLTTYMPVFQLIALDQPKLLTHKVNKLTRAFLWACIDGGPGSNA